MPEQAMLEHADCEAQRVRNKKKSNTGKRSVKTPRKTKTLRKTKINFNNHDNSTQKNQAHNGDGMHTTTPNEVITFDAIQSRVQKVKVQVHDLNPIRRARQLNYESTRANNPNVPGQDNGLNAWLNMQLAKNEFTSQEREMVNYAKKNSDKSGCYEVDHVPIKGPCKEVNKHPILINNNASNLAKKARELIEDDQISICRHTGVHFAKGNRNQQPQQQTPAQQLVQTGQHITHNVHNNECNNTPNQAQLQAGGYTEDRNNRYTEYDTDWDEHDEQEQIYHDEFTDIDSDNEYWHDQSPPRPLYQNPYEYDDEAFHFRCSRQSPSPRHRNEPVTCRKKQAQSDRYRSTHRAETHRYYDTQQNPPRYNSPDHSRRRLPATPRYDHYS